MTDQTFLAPSALAQRGQRPCSLGGRFARKLKDSW
jgi:hypothetical protein